MPGTDTQKDDALLILYDWFQEQLSKYHEQGFNNRTRDNSVPDAKDTIVDTQRRFVRTQLAAILRELNIQADLGERLVTVRKRFCELHNYLRPVYAEPVDLNRYMSEPSQQVPFGFDFGPGGTAFDGLIEPYDKDELGFLCVHPVGSGNGSGAEGARNFRERIDGFWHRLCTGPRGDESGDVSESFAARVDKLNAMRNSSGSQLYCMFGGSFDIPQSSANSIEGADGSRGLGAPRLSDIFAVYFVHRENWRPDEAQLKGARAPAKGLFKGLQLIEQLDAKLFELQGLRAMAELLPMFVDPELPRSDKISEALMRFKEQMQHHLIGRPEWGGGKDAELFYLSASFEDDRGWIPRLEMYPQAYRNNYPLVSLLVNHPFVPSASKFLLKSYLEENWEKFDAVKEGAQLAPSFTQTLSAEKLGVPPFDQWKHRVIRRENEAAAGDCLYMVEHDTEIVPNGSQYIDPWKALNHSADPGGAGSRSLLAFVIEGDKRSENVSHGWAFPRGILAFESGAIDAFSDADINALREVVRAFASLVRLITHDNACLEYRSKLSQAFDSELQNILPKDPVIKNRRRKFVFSVRKINGDQFHDVLDILLSDTARAQNARTLLNLSQNDLETLVRFKTPIDKVLDGEVLSEVEANKIVASRVEWAIDLVRALYGDPGQGDGGLTEAVVELLFACTENFQWAAYLSSVAQALGDRAATAVPTFKLMTPGYSASRMFMASVQRELRQVVKLSEYGKLNKERENYRTYVRYRLVNSARMPGNGFAFDGVGWIDRNKPDARNRRFGALVSDLISAGEEDERDPIKTFVSLLSDCVLERTTDPTFFRQVQYSIKRIFQRGTTLWREEHLKDDIDWDRNVGEYIREANRLPATMEDARRKEPKINRSVLDMIVQSYADLYKDSRRNGEIAEILYFPFQTLPSRDVFRHPVYQISHRDLNGRNLTWSSALTTFLLIDFEHVGEGYCGFDQCRLWLNAICDLYGEAINGVARPREVHKVAAAVDSLIGKTEELLDHLVVCSPKDDRSLEDYIEENLSVCVEDYANNERISPGKSAKEDYFCTFFCPLLLNIGAFEGISTLLIYSFYCCALKEFQYSCREIDSDKLKAILRITGPLAEVKSIDIHEAFDKVEDFGRRSIRSLYFRHMTAARLLNVALTAASALRDRDRDMN